jgi:hypothetical protein
MTWIQADDIEPIVVLALDDLRDPVTGKTDVKLKIYRKYDDYFLDWDDNQFKPAVSVTTLTLQMEEVNAVYAPGEYRLNYGAHIKGFNPASITNAQSEDVYFFIAIQDGGTDVANLPQVGQIRVGGYIDALVIEKTPYAL